MVPSDGHKYNIDRTKDCEAPATSRYVGPIETMRRCLFVVSIRGLIMSRLAKPNRRRRQCQHSVYMT